jgi:hypothetical protein
MDQESFPITFVTKRAYLYRAVLLTRRGPCVVETDQVNMIQGRRTLYFNEAMAREAQRYFPREVVYLWVESVDEAGEALHRSPLIRFRLIGP